MTIFCWCFSSLSKLLQLSLIFFKSHCFILLEKNFFQLKHITVWTVSQLVCTEHGLTDDWSANVIRFVSLLAFGYSLLHADRYIMTINSLAFKFTFVSINETSDFFTCIYWTIRFHALRPTDWAIRLLVSAIPLKPIAWQVVWHHAYLETSRFDFRCTRLLSKLIHGWLMWPKSFWTSV